MQTGETASKAKGTVSPEAGRSVVPQGSPSGWKRVQVAL